LIRAGVTEIQGEKELYSNQSKSKERIPGFASIPEPTASGKMLLGETSAAGMVFRDGALLVGVFSFAPPDDVAKLRRKAAAVTSAESLPVIASRTPVEAASVKTPQVRLIARP
jgi:hypothetical protein